LARAEIQHRWHLVGDPRGTYGRYRRCQQHGKVGCVGSNSDQRD
jgi:hypothetical protein